MPIESARNRHADPEVREVIVKVIWRTGRGVDPIRPGLLASARW
jgi:hypothetical protein